MERPPELERIAQGDRNALTQIYKEYQSDFYGWSRKMFKISREEAEEIFQESVVTLYENVINHKLTTMKSSLKTYLFAIGKNKALEFLRRSNRQDSLDAHPHLDEDKIFIESDPVFDSDSELIRKQKLMKACIVNLGDTCQEILTLFYFHNSSLAQIKEKLSYKNEESVKSQKFKCMERLRSNFMKQYQEWI